MNKSDSKKVKIFDRENYETLSGYNMFDSLNAITDDEFTPLRKTTPKYFETFTSKLKYQSESSDDEEVEKSHKKKKKCKCHCSSDSNSDSSTSIGKKGKNKNKIYQSSITDKDAFKQLLPKTFSNLKHENAKQWLTEFKNYVQIQNLQWEQISIYLSCYLKNKAYEWWIQNHELIDNFKTFYIFFKNTFCKQESNEMIWNKLLTTKQKPGENALEFLTDYITIFNKLDYLIPEREKVNMAINHMSDDWKTTFKRNKPIDLITLKFEIIKIERENLSNTENTESKQTYNNKTVTGTKPKIKCTFCQKPGHYENSCFLKNQEIRGQKFCTICKMNNHDTSECYYNKSRNSTTLNPKAKTFIPKSRTFFPRKNDKNF